MKNNKKNQIDCQKVETKFDKKFYRFIKNKFDISLIESAINLSKNYYDQYMEDVSSNKIDIALSSKYNTIAKEAYRIGALCGYIKKKDGVDIVEINEKGNFYYRLADFIKGNFDFITIDKLYTQNSIKKDVENFEIICEKVRYNDEYNIKIRQSDDNNMFLVLPKHKFAGFVKTIELKMYIKNGFDCGEFIVDDDCDWSGEPTVRKITVETEQGGILLSDLIFADLYEWSCGHFIDEANNFKCEIVFPEKVSDMELKKMYK